MNRKCCIKGGDSIDLIRIILTAKQKLNKRGEDI